MYVHVVMRLETNHHMYSNSKNVRDSDTDAKAKEAEQLGMARSMDAVSDEPTNAQMP